MPEQSSFTKELLHEMFQAHNFMVEERNYDPIVFAHFGAAGEDGTAFAEWQPMQLLSLIEHGQEYEEVYNLFEDEESKTLFKKVLLYRMLGHKHIKLPTNTPYYWEMRDKAINMGIDSQLDYSFGERWPLQHYEFDWRNYDIKLDCFWGGPFYACFMEQYHLNHTGMDIYVEEGDHVIDAGACFGDVSIAFSALVGETGRVYSFDFIEAHLKILQHNIQQNDFAKNNVVVLPYGVGDTDNKDAKAEDHGVNPGKRIDGEYTQDTIPTRTIDALHEDGTIERVDFIKMDIESYEPNALIGATKTIQKFKPKLAISIYHEYDHFFEIPLLIKKILPEYKLYLDHHTIHHRETILYACV